MDRTRWYVALATRYVRYTFINILSRSNQSNGRRGEEGKKKRNVRETMTHDPRWINPRPKKNPSSLRSRNPLRSGNQNICPRAIDFRRGEKKKGEILLSRVKKKREEKPRRRRGSSDRIVEIIDTRYSWNEILFPHAPSPPLPPLSLQFIVDTLPRLVSCCIRALKTRRAESTRKSEIAQLGETA